MMDHEFKDIWNGNENEKFSSNYYKSIESDFMKNMRKKSNNIATDIKKRLFMQMLVLIIYSGLMLFGELNKTDQNTNGLLTWGSWFILALSLIPIGLYLMRKIDRTPKQDMVSYLEELKKSLLNYEKTVVYLALFISVMLSSCLFYSYLVQGRFSKFYIDYPIISIVCLIMVVCLMSFVTMRYSRYILQEEFAPFKNRITNLLRSLKSVDLETEK